jgi:hypothetical protein
MCSNDFFQCFKIINNSILGEGSHAVVKKCVHKKTGKEYAVKILRSGDEELIL